MTVEERLRRDQEIVLDRALGRRAGETWRSKRVVERAALAWRARHPGLPDSDGELRLKALMDDYEDVAEQLALVGMRHRSPSLQLACIAGRLKADGRRLDLARAAGWLPPPRDAQRSGHAIWGLIDATAKALAIHAGLAPDAAREVIAAAIGWIGAGPYGPLDSVPARPQADGLPPDSIAAQRAALARRRAGPGRYKSTKASRLGRDFELTIRHLVAHEPFAELGPVYGLTERQARRIVNSNIERHPRVFGKAPAEQALAALKEAHEQEIETRGLCDQVSLQGKHRALHLRLKALDHLADLMFSFGLLPRDVHLTRGRERLDRLFAELDTIAARHRIRPQAILKVKNVLEEYMHGAPPEYLPRDQAPTSTATGP